MVNLHEQVSKVKLSIIKQLEKQSDCLLESYMGTEKVSNEGYVIINKITNKAIKLVNRLEFSRNNYNNENF